MAQEEFMIDVLKTIYEADLHDYLYYVVKDNKVIFNINCNDLFYWATGDAQDLTIENLSILKQSIDELKKISIYSLYEAPDLFCCKVRKMRPQKPYYKYIKEDVHHLFDACGPERRD